MPSASITQKHFNRFRKPLAEPSDFVEAQVNSFTWLLEEGIKEIFKEFSPLKDYSGKKFDLEFVKIEIGEPKFNEHYAKANKHNYDVPLRAMVRVKNKALGTVKEQEIFLADFPLMTDHGTFIINGVERVIVPQLARSFGVFFTGAEVKSKKYFGAKIIPARGAWIEIEGDPDGGLYVRIDRKRKFPATSLLRVLGAKFDKDMQALLKSAPGGKEMLEVLLAKDTAKTVEDAYVEIHKKLRDGDLATPENAKEFIDSIFNEERYDLSKVGRYRFNQRFGKSLDDKEVARKTLSLDDLVTILAHVLTLQHTAGSMEDDIDHLGSRRVRYVGEMLQQRLRVGMSHMKRNIQDRMSTIDAEATLPVQFINPRPLQARIKEFFTTNQLSQFMQQENVLSELEHLRTLSALGPGGLTRERAGFEVRDVHPSHYGRLCPIHTPEGPNIGLILHLATHARLNEFGMIEAPYAKVKDGIVTKEVVYLNALEEERHNIAHAAIPYDESGKITAEKVEVRIGGKPGLVSPSEVSYIDVAPNQGFSVATSMIPFLEHDDANRALMGSNMQKQATPCVIPEAPLVATGIEERAARDVGRLILAKEEGVVTEVDAKHVTVKNAKGKETSYSLVNFVRTNGFTSFHQRPSVALDQKVKKGDVLADTSSTDRGQMALGQNALVAFMCWSGANYEDAIIISERLVKDSKFTSIHIEEFVASVRDTKLGPEVTTHDIPNVGEAKLKNLDEDGIVRIGSEVRPGDILVGKITPKGETQLTPEERLLRSIFGDKARDVKDTSLRMENGKRGRIIGVKVFSREKGDQLDSGIIKRIHIEVAQIRNVSVGDKLAGRHGNKGVISRILPEEDMPYTEDGRPVDIILTPLGVPSRMNLGQILELHLGLAANSLNYQAVCPPFMGATDEEIKEELTKAGFKESGKMKLYDGRTGESFNQEIAVGYMYILKLHHMVEDKIHMRSIGPYSLITQQPLGGKAQGGGQRFGEMEVWALLGYGSAYTLREVLTIKSDDIIGRSAAFDAIVKGEKITHHSIPASFNVLLYNLRGLSLDVELKKNGETGHAREKTLSETGDFDLISLRLASPERILEWSHGEVTKPETINYRTQRSEKNGLFDERIFGPERDFECYCGKYRGVRYKGIVCEKCGVEVTRSIVRRERMGHIDLSTPVSHIWFLRGIPSRLALLLGISATDLEKVVYFAGYVVTDVNEEERKRILADLDVEYKSKVKNLMDEKSKDRMKELFVEAKHDIESIQKGKVLDEAKYHRYAIKYGALFEAGIGAEAIYNLCKKLDLKALESYLEERLGHSTAIERDKAAKRISLVRAMLQSGVRPEWMFLTRIPVIPPGIRPMVALDGGRHATSDINDLYRRVINRNNRLKKLLEIKAPDVILRNEKRILQEAVDALIDNSIRHGNAAYSATTQARSRPLKSLSDNLKGKHGIFRQNLLGKRVDYSGRSVIVIGPDLKLNQCGLPKHMALELFRPFVISKLLERELAYNIRGAGRLIDEGVPEVWAILEEVIKNKYVLLNRAPTLHRLGIQAFQPILIEGNAIQVHPLVCYAFNADFDGDQMAVHVPLSDEAQAEAREIMASDKNLLKPGNGEPVLSAKLLDIVLGCYWMTKVVAGEKGEGMVFQSPNAAITAYDFGVVGFRSKIKVLGTSSLKYQEFGSEVFETSVGRLLFNSVLPSDYPFINAVIERKKLASLVDDLIERYGFARIPEIMDKIKAFGFRYVTNSGTTWGLDDIKVPVEKDAIVVEAQRRSEEVLGQFNEGLLSEEERLRKNVEIWHAAKGEIEKVIPNTLVEDSSVYDMLHSGARGSLSQVTNMAGMKGLIASTSGETIEFPVISSAKEGLTPIEYFITTHGSRKGLADTALNTAKAGYLTRRLFDVAQDVIVREEDCGTKEGLRISRTSASGIGTFIARNIEGRHLALDVLGSNGEVLFKKGHFMSKKDAASIESSNVAEVTVRSPIGCQVIQGVCRICYGADLGTAALVNLGEAIGTVAAQAIGEPGTQLTMRTFHAGGVASAGGDITQGLPRVEEIFERRMPKNPAAVAHYAGTVTNISEDGKEKIITVLADADEKIKEKGSKKSGETEYKVYFRRMPLVKEGQHVEKGQLLTDGSADISELFRFGGRERAQDYIIAEVSKIYELQGASISTKHIEVIVKQMFSRRKVKDGGDTDFSAGDIVGAGELDVVNGEVREKEGAEAKADSLLMGILDVSLNRASFLSAASFQNTTRMLIKASVRGSIDRLTGLKENVIIGRLIPAGTGFQGGPKQEMIQNLGKKVAPTQGTK